jgi:hypothetical protein
VDEPSGFARRLVASQEQNVSNPVVTVARFSDALEAELARNLLESHGISAIVAGDNVATLNVGALGGLTQIYVSQSDAETAAELLAQHFDKAELEEDWEERVGSDSDLWVCSICGGAVSKDLDVCDACETPRGAIQSNDGVIKRQTWGKNPSSSQAFTKPGERASDPPATQLDHDVESEIEINAPDIKLYPGDALAMRAFYAACFSVLCGLTLWYSVLLIALIGIKNMELSADGRQYFKWTVVIVIASFVLLTFLALGFVGQRL